jgi:uncharacterized protein
MTWVDPTLFGGLLMGLASALHCGAMCSGICGSALLFLRPDTQAERLGYLLALQFGRVVTYASLGAVGSLIGSSLITPDVAAHFRMLQWASAVALMAMGLSMAGMLPRIPVLDRGAATLASTVAWMVAPLQKWRGVSPVVLGMIWGANACPMVYGALFTATLTGSVVNGVTFMTGFGIGTLPAMLAAGYGISLLKVAGGRQSLQLGVGIGIAVVGFATLYTPWPATAFAFCLTR